MLSADARATTGPLPPGRRASSHLPYLFSQRGTLVFRVRVPVALQACLGKREYRRSLGPSYAGNAKIHSLKLAAAAHEIFALVRAVVTVRSLGHRYTTDPEALERTRLAQENQLPPGMYTNLNGRTLDSLTDEEIRSMAEDWLLAALKGHSAHMAYSAKMRQAKSLSPEQAHIQNKERMEAAKRIRQKHAAIHKAALAQRDMSHMRPETERMLALYGVTIPPDPTDYPQYDKTGEELAKAHVTFYKLEDEYADGDFARYEEEMRRLEATCGKPLPQPLQPIAQENQDGTETITLSAAIEDYCREKKLDESWEPKVAVNEVKKLELFQSVIDPDGTMTVNAIRPKHLTSFKTTMFQMLANKGKKKDYRDMPLSEVILLAQEGKIPKALRMSTNTVKTYCQTASAFLKWAAAREYHAKPSMSELLQVKSDKKPHELRQPFTDADIVKLFSPPMLLSCGNAKDLKATLAGGGSLSSGGKPSRFWLPLLGLFTGARLEELASLHTDDLLLINRQEDVRRIFEPGKPPMSRESVMEAQANGETLCLNLGTDKDFQRVKTSWSVRRIPLSPVLAFELGFMGYAGWIFGEAEKARAKGRTPAGDGRLFPELKRADETRNFAEDTSKWFGSYKVKAGIKDRKKVFHSFRHTLSNWCQLQGNIQEKAVSRQLGHSHDTMTFGRYGADTAAHVLYEHVVKGYGEHLRTLLDIDGLKRSKWANHAG